MESELRPHSFVHSLLLSLRLQTPHRYVPTQKKRTMLSRSVVDEPRVWALGGYWPQTYRHQVLQVQCNRAIKTRWAKATPRAHANHMFYMIEWVRCSSTGTEECWAIAQQGLPYTSFASVSGKSWITWSISVSQSWGSRLCYALMQLYPSTDRCACGKDQPL